MKFWNSYKYTVIKNCTESATEEYTIRYWGNVLFSNLILYLLPFSIIAIIPGVIFSFLTGFIMMGIIDCLILIFLIHLALYPGFSVETRKNLLILCCYFASAVLILMIGVRGPGLTYLVITTVIFVLIFPGKNAYLPSWVNTIIIAAMTGLILLGEFKWDYQEVPEAGHWIAVASNNIFLSFALSAFVPKIFLGIQNAIDNQLRLKSQLEEKERSLSLALAEVESKNQEIAEFAVIASHDLKEPLRTAVSLSELIIKKYSANLEQQIIKLLNLIISSARRGISLTEDLLDYSRIYRESGESTLIDTNKLVHEVVRHFKTTGESRDIQFTISDLPHVYGRENALHRMFYNLIGNGIKYARPDVRPEISISARDTGAAIEFSVSDNGIGIEKEHLGDIFRIFKRLHTREEIDGTGVGLAACKKIAEQHGGAIWAESQCGCGTVFYFTIAKKKE